MRRPPRRSQFCHSFAVVPFAQFLQQPLLTAKSNVSNNFGDRLNGGVLRPPAMFMFYDFAPHGDGANNARRPVGVDERLALCLLFVSECVITEVVSEFVNKPDVVEFASSGA